MVRPDCSPGRGRSRGGRERPARAFGSAGLGACLLVAAACGWPDEGAAPPPAEPRAGLPVRPTTAVRRIEAAPARFDGEHVRVTGEVDELFSARAFTLEGTRWAFDDDLVVLAREPVQFAGLPLARGDELLVRGTVHRAVTPDVERELGWTLAPELAAGLRGRAVLVASSIRKVGEYKYLYWSAGPDDAPRSP